MSLSPDLPLAKSLPSVLLAHNHYRLRAGEDAVFETEASMLDAHGIRAITYRKDSADISSLGRARTALLPLASLWDASVASEIGALLRKEAPFISHFHNIFPLISPSAYARCRQEGIPVVQTMHNYRLFCIQGLFLRDGHPCQDCLGRSVGWPGLAHACYHGSLAESLAITAFNSVHGAAGTWLNQVDTYIALSEFARRKFIEGGIPPSQITVKPNCVPDPGPPSPFPRDGTILYVGRLTAGKGVADLLESLAMLKLHDRLRVVGDGEEADRLRKLAKARGFPRGAFLGALYGDAVVEQIRAATCLVIPSRHYETFGRTVIESFACGRPVVASRRGSLPELVEPGCTGYLFEGGDAGSLAAALQNLVGSPDGGAAMGREAREVWSRKYSPEPNVRMLASIYRMTLERLGMRVPERLAVLSECV